MLKERTRGKEGSSRRKLSISEIKANPIGITKTRIKYYYELYDNELEKVEKMDKFLAKLNLKNKRSSRISA